MVVAGGLRWFDADVRRGRVVSLLWGAAPSPDRVADPATQELLRHGAWVPYWQYDAICIESGLADEIAERFRVHLLDVEWHATPPGKARQIIAPQVGDRWFNPDQLRARLIARHGTPGAECAECGVWRWMPLGFAPVPPLTTEVLPPLLDVPEFEDAMWSPARSGSATA